ncbi:MAG TPA: response regulator [Phycisphaerales bacterium]|nr:response regulator [Phycisphaerales bacterium]
MKAKILCADIPTGDIYRQLCSLCGQDTQILTAGDGHEALRLLKLHGSSVRLAIFNTLLPVMDGVSLCRNIRKSERWQTLPVVLVGDNEKEREASLEAGCTEYLSRPCSKAKLSEILDKALCLVWDESEARTRDQLSILVVDDTKQVRTVVRRFLTSQNYKVEEAESGEDMNRMLKLEIPDIIILDIMLPKEDGLTILRRLKQNPDTKEIPVIIVSGLGEVEIVAQALEDGAADYLTKPICSKRLTARVKNCHDTLKLRRLEREQKAVLEEKNVFLQRRVQRQMEHLKKSHHGTIFCLSKLAESRDPETGEHLERLQEYCRAICHALLDAGHFAETLSEHFIENLAAASPLHDIGKVGIPDAVLLKPGRLTPEEFDIMKTHAQLGADTLMAASEHCGNNPLIEMGIEIAQFHHEKWDGSGYPTGLSGDSIPLSARILALGDVYDALTSKRVYKDAFSHEKSRDIIVEGRGQHFDPKVVDAFLAVEDEFRRIRETFSDPVTPEVLAV